MTEENEKHVDIPGLLEAITQNGRNKVLPEGSCPLVVPEFQKGIYVTLNILFELACHDQTGSNNAPCTICNSSLHSAPWCNQNAFNIWKARGYCGGH